MVEITELDEATTTARDVVVEEARKRRTGGFDVQYRNAGEATARAFYDQEARTIFINLDHPQISTARGDAEISDPSFRRLSFEVAFTEYACALSYELAKSGSFMDLFEPLQEVRDTIDRLSRKASSVFAAT